MPKYMAEARYTKEGLPGLIKDGGSGRLNAIRELASSVGGKVECLYYAFGETDLFVVLDLPDNVSAVALSLIVNSTGAATTKLTPLLSPEEIDEAARKSVNYRAPGK